MRRFVREWLTKATVVYVGFLVGWTGQFVTHLVID